MARILTTGFELGSPIPEPGITGGDGSDLAIRSTFSRSGDYALRVEPALNQGNLIYTVASSNIPHYYRVYFYLDTATTADHNTAGFGFLDFHSGAIKILLLGSAAGFKVIEGSSATNVSMPLTIGQWYRLEVEIDLSPASGSRVVGFYVDGVQLYRNTASTQNYSVAGGGYMQTSRSETAAGGVWWLDDLAINTNAGSAPHNTFPGSGKVIRLFPDSNGDAATGGSTRGGTDSGTFWGQMDEVVPNDATDYVILPANPSDVCVGITDVTSRISANDTIRFVEVHGSIAGASGTAANWFPGIMSQSAGTRVYGAAVTLGSSGFATNDDTFATRECKLRQLTDPQAGGAWTQSLLNNTQLIARTTDGNPDTYVSALWALVEYVPSAVATLPPPINIRQAVHRASRW